MVPLTPKRPHIASLENQPRPNRRHVDGKAFYLAVFSVSHRTPVGQTESLLLIRIETG
jgi:hypothetical protein